LFQLLKEMTGLCIACFSC